MKEIKRFHEGGYGTTEMKLSDYGDWVLYDDHAAIVAEKDSRISELETMFQRKVVQDGNKITALQEQVRALAAENEVLRNVFGPGEAVLNFLTIALRHTTYDEIDLSDVSLAFKMSLPETPETDVVIREIRAQAVGDAGDRIRFVISEFPESSRDIVEECACIAGELAARIRSGEQP